jgi:hypothetical protein
MKKKRKTVYVCDVCGREITENVRLPWKKQRYEFKFYDNKIMYKHDMCTSCFEKFKDYVNYGVRR